MRHLKILAIGLVVSIPLIMFFASSAMIGNGPRPSEARELQAVETDPRTAIVLPAPARDFVLTEMRGMLVALNGVLVAAARGEVEAMSEAALSGGTIMAVDMDPALRGRLPEQFMNLGMKTHRSFDDLAAALDSGIGMDDVLNRLGQLTGNCVVCHAQYRIELENNGP